MAATCPARTESQVTSTSNSSAASPLPSPGYETLGSDEDDWQKVDVCGLARESSSDEDSNSESKSNTLSKRDIGSVVTVKDPRLNQVKEEFLSLPHGCGDDLSDAESLASMDMLSDDQIDLLIKGNVFSPRRRSLEPFRQTPSARFERGTEDPAKGDEEHQGFLGDNKSETKEKTSDVKRGHMETSEAKKSSRK